MILVRWGTTAKWHLQTKSGLACGLALTNKDLTKIDVLTLYEIRGYPRSVCKECFK
jgi:hypothetical protein